MYLTNVPSYSISEGNINIKDNVASVDLSKVTQTTDKESDKIPVSVNDAKQLTTAIEKLEVLTDYKIEEFPYSFEECIDIAYKNRADLKAYNSTLDAVKQHLLMIKRNYYPDLSAQAGYGFRNQENTNSLNVGVNLSSSLNIMAHKYEVDEAKYQVDIAHNSLNKLNQDIYFAVQNAYINMIECVIQLRLSLIL